MSGPFAARIAAASGLDPDRITVLPNAVPVERFPLASAAERDPQQLLWVGARGEKKGTEVLLRAFARVHAERPATRLQLVGGAAGDGSDDPWRALAAELGLAEVVAFEPAADREGVARAMARAAVFVHPSPAETFGIVAAEALATGLPVAATRSGGVEAILGSSGRFGELADGTDAESLAAAILRLLDRRTELDPAAMRDHVEAEFGSPDVARRMIAIYEELMAGASQSVTRAPTDADGEWLPAGRDAESAPLVVALSRPLLSGRLAPLSAITPPGLTLVTTVAPDGGEPTATPDGARLVEVDPDADHRAAIRAVAGPSLAGLPEPLRRVLRFALSPRAALRRRQLFAERPRTRRATVQAAVLEAWRAHREQASPAEAGWLVACDADDLDAAARAIAAGARLAPGGLRWLADRWSSADDYDGGRAKQ